MNIFSWVTMTIKLEGPLPISTLTREREREREKRREKERQPDNNKTIPGDSQRRGNIFFNLT